jgi:predicted DNA-binding transcriptional regulator AlpA
MEKPRNILRPKAAFQKLGCGKTKFDDEYRHHDDAEPDVTGAPGVKRVKPIPLGSRNIGYLEHEIDDLIDGLTKLRDAPKAAVADHIPQVRKVRTARKAAAGKAALSPIES